MQNSLFKPRFGPLALLIGPALVLFIVFVIVPIILALWFSFFNWSGGKSMSFAGLANYANLIVDAQFWATFGNNIFLIAFCLVGQIGIGFLLAMLICGRALKLKEFHRAVIFFPVVISAVVIGFMWSMIYNKDFGLLNYLLRGLGLEGWIRPYLDEPKTVMLYASIPVVWQYIGLYMVLFLTGIQSIDPAIFEVAEIDGASSLQRARHITLPLLMDTLKVAVMLCIAGNMKIFDHIFIMTGGGPGKSSMVMAMYAYNQTFEMFKLGYSSAISIGIMILSLGMILASRGLLRARGDQ
jgi:raffinose/stachyose/melibiose transport system permease protein